jgi:hypothetical protein
LHLNLPVSCIYIFTHCALVRNPCTQLFISASNGLSRYLDGKDGLLYRKPLHGAVNLHLDLVVAFDNLEPESETALQKRSPVVSDLHLRDSFQKKFEDQYGAALPAHAYRLLRLLRSAHPTSVKRVVRFNKPRDWKLSFEDRGSLSSDTKLRNTHLLLEIALRENLPVASKGPESLQKNAESLVKSTDFDIQKICLEAEPSLSEDQPVHLAGTELGSDAIEQLVDHISSATLDAGNSLKFDYTDSVGEQLANTAANALTEKWPSVHVRSVRVDSLHRKDKIKFKIITDFGSKSSPELSSAMAEDGSLQTMQRVFVALGSNMGDKFEMIERACKEMEAAGIVITRTSGLWETKAMYVEDQNNFLNGACEVRDSCIPKFRSYAFTDECDSLRRYW